MLLGSASAPSTYAQSELRRRFDPSPHANSFDEPQDYRGRPPRGPASKVAIRCAEASHKRFMVKPFLSNGRYARSVITKGGPCCVYTAHPPREPRGPYPCGDYHPGDDNRRTRAVACTSSRKVRSFANGRMGPVCLDST